MHAYLQNVCTWKCAHQVIKMHVHQWAEVFNYKYLKWSYSNLLELARLNFKGNELKNKSGGGMFPAFLQGVVALSSSKPHVNHHLQK